MPNATTSSDYPATERQQADTDLNAELGSLIRRLAAVRPDILIPEPPHPTPTLAPAPPAPAPPPAPIPPPRPVPAPAHRPTREDYPVDRDVLDTITRLCALKLGTHKPDDHWPAHADDAFRAKKLRVPLGRRVFPTLRRTAQHVFCTIGILTTATAPIAATALLLP
ncbi:MAG: hypothetical protein M0026_16290 [Nocardiopsaceae bacterium]|nr:hypothetical protein [Nocardiopsaceae bacterium]